MKSKKILKQSTNIKQQLDQNSDLNCICEVLCQQSEDDSKDLSDCSCDDCIEAMAEAYNQCFQEYQKKKTNKSRQKYGGIDSQPTKRIKIQKNKSKQKQRRKNIVNQNKNCEKFTRQNNRLRQTEINNQNQQSDSIEQSQQPQNINISAQQYPYNQAQLIFRVNQRIQQNLIKYKKMKKQQMQSIHQFRKSKQQRLEKIKSDLQKLKYKSINFLKKAKSIPLTTIPHKKEWNYALIEQAKRQKNQQQQNKKNEKKQFQSYIKPGMIDQKKLQQHEFLKNIHNRVKQQLKKRRLVSNKIKANCIFDKCKKHHMRTPNEQIAKTSEKIKQNAKNYLLKLKEQKRKEQDNLKLIKAKLRGIQLEAKKKLKKSKKYGDIQRSTFNLELDHFSTFSEMRQMQANKLQQKKFQKESKHQNKNIQIKKQNQNPNQMIQKNDPEKRMQVLKQIKKELKEEIILKKVVQQNNNIKNQAQSSKNKFYVWDIPIKQDQVKNIFAQASLSQPKIKKQEQNFREEVQNTIFDKQKKKVEENIKKKQDKIIQERLQKKKQEILLQYQKKRQSVYSTSKQKSSKNIKNNKKQTKDQKFLDLPAKSNKQIKKQYLKKNKQKQLQPQSLYYQQENQPVDRAYEIYPTIMDQGLLKEKKLIVEDPILKKTDFNDRKNVMQSVDHILLDNQLFNEEDKKVFVLNYRMLSSAKTLIL